MMHTQQLIEAVSQTQMPAWGGDKHTFYRAKTKWVEAINELEKEWELWLAEMYARDLSRDVQILIFEKVKRDVISGDSFIFGSRYVAIEHQYAALAVFTRQAIDLH